MSRSSLVLRTSRDVNTAPAPIQLRRISANSTFSVLRSTTHSLRDIRRTSISHLPIGLFFLIMHLFILPDYSEHFRSLVYFPFSSCLPLSSSSACWPMRARPSSFILLPFPPKVKVISQPPVNLLSSYQLSPMQPRLPLPTFLPPFLSFSFD